ncbi:YqgE/AlgH family protein [Alloalcanivorax profundimaris]|uniref:YqgE/AlgH family protein n=1 Tax=Alloalcanivorax profundimaris TaxID=2735259 RepID=UPI001888FE12|nr:YqgE/AlgH family protein [Alloalcanivorax profundimaris]MBF1803300.1 YqgE/AlgH family protein [Alloalcanivorax profundimaris]MCQ6260334.1 YqgE/AlgH family protein [Alcanivorax sp. MM125-6]
MESASLKHQLLIAMPQMDDPNFEHAVTYVVEHGKEGAMGLTLNRPVSLSLNDILADMDIEVEVPPSDHHQVVAGGPIQQDSGFVLHRSTARHWDSSIQLADGLCLTTSRDIMEAIALGEGPEATLVCLGYAGWDEGQLERELADNVWLSVASTPELVLDTPFDQRWQAAAASLGVDISLIATQVGHG